MIKSFFSVSLLLMVSLFSACGGSHTTIVVVPATRTYTIDIIKFSAKNPIGDTYVKATNKYGSMMTNSPSVDLILTDHLDDAPITLQLRDAAGLIFSETVVLTDPDYLSAKEITIQDGSDPDNYITFAFTILQ